MSQTDATQPFTTINFNSLDGLQMWADYYPVDNPRGFILLCHRSHCNRGEYRETAPKFNALGYSCLAIDQRSGMKIFGVTNETKNLAKSKKLPTGYLDAQQDIEAAIDYAYELNNQQPIILFGSSYSAALALFIAEQNRKFNALILFSPNECLKQIQLAERLGGVKKPIFATSAHKEIDDTRTLLSHIDPQYVTQFEPEVEGFHGSKALWESVKGYETYWAAMETFLDGL